jgi:hypothetical protein
MQKTSNTWFTKTLSSIKEAATTAKTHQAQKLHQEKTQFDNGFLLWEGEETTS